MNQWCGINSLAYFLPITFERNIGLSTHLSLIISGVLGIQYFFVSWLSVHPLRKSYYCLQSPSPYFFIERLGRRKMLMSSSAACCFCMIMISSMLALNTTIVSPSSIRFLAFYGVLYADSGHLDSLNGSS